MGWGAAMRDNEKPAAGTAGDRQATVSVQQRTPAPTEASATTVRASHNIECPDYPLPEPAVCRARVPVTTRAGLLVSVAWDALVDAISGRPLVARSGKRETALPPAAVATARAALSGTVLDEAGQRLVWLCAVRLEGAPEQLAVAHEHAATAGACALYWRTPGALWVVLAADAAAARLPVAGAACQRLAQSWAPQARCILIGASRWVPLAIDPDAGPKRTCWVWPLSCAELSALAAEIGQPPIALRQDRAAGALEDALTAWTGGQR